MDTNRRQLIKASAAAGTGLAFPATAWGQAQYRLKFANIMPVDHPLNGRMAEAGAQIKMITNGQVDIQVFPASQLGGDADMLAQLHSGSITFLRRRV
jgi:TRAP-type transport system periplasmic protein